ncbi:MAG TPA: fasciclin domain-containing protein [candidate division Zixibacteria bacterium]|nr:fasciclin domain-containing protein [candidate division Zixibacteria bacterium]
MKKSGFLLVIFAFVFAMFFGVSSNAVADNCTAKSASKTEISKDIVETAMANDNFKTLVAAVKAAGLVEALKGDGPFTVFAPTDEAFAALPEGTLEALLKDKEKLTAILKYHVVSGKVMAGDVVKVKSAETLNGQSVAVKVDGKKVMIDNAEVIMTDIVASNGVIHVIDEVILPREAGKRSEY